MSQHASIKAFIHGRSFSLHHSYSSLRKRIGRSINRRVGHLMLSAMSRVSDRVPVKGGEVEGRKMAMSTSSLPPGLRYPTSRSSRTGREQMRARKLEDEMIASSIQANSRTVEGDRNFLVPEFNTLNRTTLGNARIQPPSSASAMVKTSAHLKDNEWVWYPGELAGSGKIFFHASTSAGCLKFILPKRCFRARGTQDLETRQHRLRVLGLSCRRSAM